MLQRARPRRQPRPGRRVIAPAAILAVVACATVAACSPRGPAGQAGPTGPTGPTYAQLGRQALGTLERSYYDGAGRWNTCVPRVCGTGNMDWGDDSLTYALYFHWSLSHDRGVRPIMNALDGTAFDYSPAVTSFSQM